MFTMNCCIIDWPVRSRIGNKSAFLWTGMRLDVSRAYFKMFRDQLLAASEQEKESEGQDKNFKILIAEDNKVSELFLTVAVKVFSKDVLIVRTGAEAVEACRCHPDIDLILMDIQMPEMDGYEATRQIRQFDKDVIIIAQTAYVLTENREKAIEAGCNDYIAKPINKDLLIALIKKYLLN